MKRYLPIIFAVLLLFPPGKILFPSAKAQGWAWGVVNRGNNIEAWSAATDDSGSVFAAGVAMKRAAYPMAPMDTFGSWGSVVLPCLGSTSQPVWVKYDKYAVALWAAGTQNGNGWLYNITTDLNGNLVVFGSFDSPTISIDTITLTNANAAVNGSQYFIAKYSSSGTLLWAKCDGSSLNNMIAINPVAILGAGGVATDRQGNIYITSSFKEKKITIDSSFRFNTNLSDSVYDIYLAKYDPSGSLIWWTTAGGYSDEFAYGITVTPAGYIYIAGTFWDTSWTFGSSVLSNPYGVGGYNHGIGPAAFIAKFSPAGTPLWASAGMGEKSCAGSIASDDMGNVYLVGSYWDTSICFDGTCITRVYNSGPLTRSEIFLAKISPTDSVVWGKTIGSPQKSLFGRSVAVSNCGKGEIWVGGGPFAVLPPPDTINVDGNLFMGLPGWDPIILVAYDFNGSQFDFARLNSGGDDDFGIACDGKGNVYVAGDYVTLTGVPYFNVAGTLHASKEGDEMLFAAKYVSDHCKKLIIDTVEANDDRSVQIFPNPANDEIIIKTTFDFPQSSELQMCDLTGRIVTSLPLKGNSNVISISVLPSGVYICRFKTLGKVDVVRKISVIR